MSPFIKQGLVFAGAFVAAAVIGTCAHAGPLRGDPAACRDLGDTVIQAGDARDQGVPWEPIKDKLQEMIDAAKLNVNSYVHTDEEAQFVTDSIHQLWLHPEDPSFVVATKVYNACMGNRGTV